MRIGIFAANDASSKRAAASASKTLRERFPEIARVSDPEASPSDVVVVIGDSRFLLDSLRRVDPKTPVLAVGHGFLAEVSPENVSQALRRVVEGDHRIDELLRIEVTVEGKRLPLALNEVALSSTRGAGFLRYSLGVDGEILWRDGGDGVIICTPTGSSGYGLSAGGPVVMQNAQAMVVVPICSSSGQGPIVVSRDSKIEISDIEGRLGRDLVIDGGKRVRLKASGFTVRGADHPAQLVRLDRAGLQSVFGKLRTKNVGAPLPQEAAPSAKFVYRLLADNGPLTERQIIAGSGLPERTVRAALAYLIRKDVVRRGPSLRDAREAVFALKR